MHLSMSARERRTTQSPHRFRSQALSPAPRRNRRLPNHGRGDAARRAAVGRPLQGVAAQASRGVRSHHRALRSRCRPLDEGAWSGPDRLGSGRCSQLLHGSREQVQEWNRREVDDQPASIPAVPGCRRPLPDRSRQHRSYLRQLAACRHAAVSDGGAGEPADRGKSASRQWA